MTLNLTEGAIEALTNGTDVHNPLLQVLNVCSFISGSDPPLTHLVMSDGLHTMSSFTLATQLNRLVEENCLLPYCVCLLKRSVTNILNDGRCRVTVLEIEVVKSAEEMGGKIGTPTPYVKGKTTTITTTPTATVINLVHYSTTILSLSLPRWTIRARVTKKNNIYLWSNPKGEGKLFSFEIVDESGEIKVTAFNKEVDKFFPLLETGKVYYISEGKVKETNKKYITSKNNYEIILRNVTSIVPCEDDQNLPMVDGFARTGREAYKRNIHLMDTSGKAVAVTLWGEQAEMFDGSVQPIVAVKRARLSDFGGQSVSGIFSSAVMVNPDIPEAHWLRRWTQSKRGPHRRCPARRGWRGGSGGSHIKATVLLCCKESCLYQACPSADCKKKVIEQPNGLYHCEKCNKQFPNYKYCLKLSANIADFSDNQWVTCFHETAEGILGHSAETLGQLKDTDEAAFDEVFRKVKFTTHVFRNRVKLETYNDESRVKATVMKVKPVDHREYSRRLISNIRKMAA
uniref:Replication protein A 70 kDa DNA-binding subunit n=1 Tax=Salmo trutta TaxID=8032 RepID=A0A674C7H3_SALTR